MSDEVVLDRRDGVAVVTLNAPKRRNALTLPMAEALTDVVEECERDEGIGAVAVTGQPPAFCAGADLTALGEAREEGLRKIYSGFLAVARCSVPTIAAVGGAAVGAGLNLALACDVRLVGPKARFDARFLQLGLHPGGGMTWMLQRAVGPQLAYAMTLLGQVIGADEAVRTGLALRSVDGDHDALIAAARELAAPAGAAPRDLVMSIKRSMRATWSMHDHAEATETELVAQVRSMDSPAFAELLAAMRAKITGSAKA